MTESPSETSIVNRRATKPLKLKKTHIEKINKPSKLMELNVDAFTSDPAVQRQLNQKRVDEIAADFRPDAMGLITASKRDNGRLYTLDGQHRVAGARQARYSGLIAARIFENLTIEEEAGLFLTLNHTRAVSSIERFKVRVTLGDRTAININNILAAYNLHVGFSASNEKNSVSAIQTLEKVYRGAGVWDDGEYSDLVDKVISTIYRAYGEGNKNSVYSRAMVEGLGIFHAHFGKRIEKDRLVEVLAGIPARNFTSRARMRRDTMGGAIGENAAEVLHSLYNHRLKTGKLPDFHKVEPRNNVTGKLDPMYVDPSQYALDLKTLEPSNA